MSASPSLLFLLALTRNQLEEDRVSEQLEMKELFDPFTGEPAK